MLVGEVDSAACGKTIVKSLCKTMFVDNRRIYPALGNAMLGTFPKLSANGLVNSMQLQNTSVKNLDNPIWYALGDTQHAFAEGNDWARRFTYDVGPLAGIAAQTAEAYAALAKLAKSGETLGLFLEEPPQIPAGWSLEADGMLAQMLCDAPMPTIEASAVELLSEADIPQMIELTQLTKPGPFRSRTFELGHYVGIRSQGRVVAMAGQRLHLPGFREVSAVCTHPDYQGRGYAGLLMKAVIRHIMSQGEVPFLHCKSDNWGAIKLYEKLGFRQRRLLYLAVVRHL